MKMQWIIGVLICVAAFGAHAQYKYIGPDGRVVYSDQPPPPSAKLLEKKAPGTTQSSGASDMPFALQQPVKNSPVTLYTAPSCGGPCSDGRNLLTGRGVPFTEKIISTPEDAAEFTKTINSQQIPVLMVGKTKVVPFAAGDWNGALDSAGYPATSQLPAGYRNPTPTNVAQSVPATSPSGPANNGTPGSATPAAPPPASADGKPSWFKGF